MTRLFLAALSLAALPLFAGRAPGPEPGPEQGNEPYRETAEELEERYLRDEKESIAKHM